MDSLLKLKHWQLFLLTGASSFVSVFVRISYILHLAFIPYNDMLLRVLEFTDLASTIIMLSWSYIAGVRLNERLQPSSQQPTSGLRFCLGGIVAAMAAPWAMPMFFEYSYAISVSILFASLGFYIYVDYFVARALVLAENENQSVGGTLVSILFFPIGIWWVQPRVNKVFSSEWESFNPDTPLDHNLGQQPHS